MIHLLLRTFIWTYGTTFLGEISLSCGSDCKLDAQGYIPLEVGGVRDGERNGYNSLELRSEMGGIWREKGSGKEN